MTFLAKFGLMKFLMDMGDLLELSKGLSNIGAKAQRFFPTPARGNANGISEIIKQKEKIFEGLWFNYGHRSPPFLSSINMHLVPKLGTSRTS